MNALRARTLAMSMLIVTTLWDPTDALVSHTIMETEKSVNLLVSFEFKVMYCDREVNSFAQLT